MESLENPKDDMTLFSLFIKLEDIFRRRRPLLSKETRTKRAEKIIADNSPTIDRHGKNLNRGSCADLIA